MNRKEKRSSNKDSDKIKSSNHIIRHIKKQNPYYSASTCVYHFNKPCLTLLNNFNPERFHCLYTHQAVLWRSYSITKSCDIPEHFYDMIILNQILGDEYVLPFAGHFRESTGYTIGMFREKPNMYPPHIINRSHFIETVFTTIVFYVAVCHRMGGNTPNMKFVSVLYTQQHPILCDVGSYNVENRERLADRQEHFNVKKWKKFLKMKTIRSVIQYLKIYFPNYFQKKKREKHCILNEEDGAFSDQTHKLVCKSEKRSLLDIIKEFRSLIPNVNISYGLLTDWIASVENESCSVDFCI